MLDDSFRFVNEARRQQLPVLGAGKDFSWLNIYFCWHPIYFTMAFNLSTIFTLCLLSFANCKTAKIRQDAVNNDLVLANVERKIDISTHLAKIVSTITIENTGTSSTGFFLYAIEPQLQENIAFLAASVS